MSELPFDLSTLPTDQTPMFLDMANLNEPAIKKYVSSFDLKARILACQACPLNQYHKTVKMDNFEAPFMVIVEHPNELNGNAQEGQFLLKALQDSGFNLDQIYLTSAVKCQASQDYARCHPFLISELIIVQPLAVLAMGYHSAYLLVDQPQPGMGVTLANGSDLLITYSVTDMMKNDLCFKHFKDSLILIQKRLNQRIQMREHA